MTKMEEKFRKGGLPLFTKILLPELIQLCLDELRLDGEILIVTLSTNSTQAICPYCATVSELTRTIYVSYVIIEFEYNPSQSP